jgi:hypothetical protein
MVARMAAMKGCANESESQLLWPDKVTMFPAAFQRRTTVGEFHAAHAMRVTFMELALVAIAIGVH